MLHEGWKRVPLCEVAEIRTGLAKGKQGLRDPISLPYLRVANVQDGYLDLSHVKFIEVDRADVERYSLKGGDVLMTEGGDFDKLGRGSVWSGQLAPCLHQNHVFVVRPHVDKLDPHYLSALSASSYGRSYFMSCAKRSTNLASINSTQLKRFPVLLPPIAEQRRIAELLRVCDQAIDAAERLLANCRQQHRALVEALVSGQTRCYGSRSEWTMRTVGQVARVSISSVDKKSLMGERPVRLCNYTDVYYNRRIDRSLEFSSATATAEEAAKFGLQQGDVIITKDSERPDDIAIPTRVVEAVPDLVCGYHLALLRPNRTVIEPEFLHNHFLLARTRAYFASRANGVTRFGLSIAAIEEAPISCPEGKEQRQIAEVISGAEEEVFKQKRDLDLLRKQKLIVRADLLSGRRHVGRCTTEIAVDAL